jgi:hypothetical protein
VARVGSLDRYIYYGSSSLLAHMGTARSDEKVVVVGMSSISERLEAYGHNPHWIVPDASTARVARHEGQKGQVMIGYYDAALGLFVSVSFLEDGFVSLMTWDVRSLEVD